MSKRQLIVDKRGYEIRSRSNHEFPIYGGINKIEDFEGRKFLSHWHKEPEFTVILKGDIYYQANDKIYHLTEGQGIFVNSNVLHSGWNATSDCTYGPSSFAHWILFDTENNGIYKKYIEPVMSCKSFSCLIFDSKKSEEDKKVLDLFWEIIKKCKEKEYGYELKCMANLMEAFSIFMPSALEIIKSSHDNKMEKAVDRTKKAIDYIENHYAEAIMLSDLAKATGLSSSEFCRSFKSIMGHTPMEYLANIRIRKSLPLLTNKEHSITEIADLCGFSGSSYYSETFKKYMGVTPSQYIKSKKGSN